MGAAGVAGPPRGRRSGRVGSRDRVGLRASGQRGAAVRGPRPRAPERGRRHLAPGGAGPQAPGHQDLHGHPDRGRAGRRVGGELHLWRGVGDGRLPRDRGRPRSGCGGARSRRGRRGGRRARSREGRRRAAHDRPRGLRDRRSDARARRSRTRPPTRASSRSRTPPACRRTRSPTSTSRARRSARRTSARSG